MSEPTLKYRVEYRYKVAPPEPYKNDWQLSYSFNNYEDAVELVEEEMNFSPMYDFRVI